MARDVIKRLIVSEKSSRLGALNQYFLEVDKTATKPQIRKAVEDQFGVHVLAVRTANVKGGLRTVRGTRRQVTESTWKRAIVEVKAGERIEMV
ncbi:MAG: 50S ribosomal protein L23 [Kiritimatiellae bacterium]|nr:50S ribosomal protein L23 [Kiritimatiellia bacterium]